MYVIQDDFGLYWAGVTCNLNIWKNHWTRAITYNTERSAQKAISYYGLEDCKVVYLALCEDDDYDM